MTGLVVALSISIGGYLGWSIYVYLEGCMADRGWIHFGGDKYRRVTGQQPLLYSKKQSRLLTVGKYTAPLSYYLAYMWNVKKELSKANKLFQCKECRKYSRHYQAAFIADTEGKCVHCDRWIEGVGSLSTDLREFLQDFPECAEVDIKTLDTIKALFEAKQHRGVVSEDNEEIQRILKSYEETGNVYMSKLYDK